MSNEPTIEQMNVTIARFMGMEGTDQFLMKNYRYDKSWDLLMPVVEKIEKSNWCVRVENWPKCFPTPYKELYSVWMWLNPEDAPEIQTYSDVKIKAVHIAVYQFIQWYNKQKEGNNETP
jgi:hypothetical protein